MKLFTQLHYVVFLTLHFSFSNLSGWPNPSRALPHPMVTVWRQFQTLWPGTEQQAARLPLFAVFRFCLNGTPSWFCHTHQSGKLLPLTDSHLDSSQQDPRQMQIGWLIDKLIYETLVICVSIGSKIPDTWHTLQWNFTDLGSPRQYCYGTQCYLASWTRYSPVVLKSLSRKYQNRFRLFFFKPYSTDGWLLSEQYQ